MIRLGGNHGCFGVWYPLLRVCSYFLFLCEFVSACISFFVSTTIEWSISFPLIVRVVLSVSQFVISMLPL